MLVAVGLRSSVRRCSLDLILLFLFSLQATVTASFSMQSTHVTTSKIGGKPINFRFQRRSSVNDESQLQSRSFSVQVNDFFKGPVPRPIRRAISLYYEKDNLQENLDAVYLLTAAPTVPGSPRPLWLVMVCLPWYAYYRFAVEEELLQMELDRGKEPRGFGGYGTVGPFTYGVLLGPLAALVHLPGGMNWSILGISFMYYTQFLLYDRVNELYTDEGRPAPLNVWWCVPIFFPFNVIVALRQVHYLSQYLYEKRGLVPAPRDPIADFFPFVSSHSFRWQDFFVTPSLWCSLLADAKNIDTKTFPPPVRDLLKSDSQPVN